MKFLAYTHANPLIQGSGGEKYLQGFLESLAEEGNFCLCLSTNEEKWKKKKHNGVFYEHENNITLEEEIEKIKPDFIITQFFKSERAIKEAHKNKIRVIYLVHNDFEISTGRELRLLKENDIAVFNTFWIGKKMNTKAKKFVIHPIIKPEKVKLTREYITLINPTKQKGAQIFDILAMKNPDKKFLAVGGGYGNQCNFKRNNITQIPNTQKIWKDVYSKTRILLMPSMYESYGMCAAEASSLGIPVIASQTAGLRECLGNSSILINSVKWIDWDKKLKYLDDDNIYLRYSEIVKQHFEEDSKKNYFSTFYNYIINGGK